MSLIKWAALATAFLSSGAWAEERVRQMPPSVVENYAWTGFYGGLHFGGIADSHFSDVGIPSGAGGTPSFTAAQAKALTGSTGNFLGGGQVGYNWRVSPVLVTGIEADISGYTSSFANSAFDAGNGVNPSAKITNGTPLDYVGTVRGRLGYLVSPPTLIYLSGGLSYGAANSTLTTAYPATVVVADAAKFGGFKLGYAIGGGIEHALSRHASLKLEAFYFDLGSTSGSISSFNTGGVAISTNTITRHLDGAVARIGVNFLF